jgi:hypothetical protein
MKLIVFLFIFFSFITQVDAQTKDSIAYSLIEKSLKVVKDYLRETNSSDVTSRALVVDFLTRLTGIPSQSDGDYIGQYSPTSQDYESWLKWYRLNKEFIYWNANTKRVIVKKEISPPKLMQD